MWETTLDWLLWHQGSHFCDFATYVRSLGFNKKLDYQHLYSILLLCSETESDQPIKAPGTDPVMAVVRSTVVKVDR